MATSYANKGDQKHGILYFQKAFYTVSQMNHISNKFKNHLDQAPRVLFSDNYRDYQRQRHQKRMQTGPQAKVLAPYDKSFGFGIPTRFVNAKALGFVNNNHNFNTLMIYLFTKLDQHLRNGGDVIVPAPLDSEIKKDKNIWISSNQIYHQYGKQVIFHNIGTSSEVFDKKRVSFIQQQIDNLKAVASAWKVIKGEVSYRNYNLYDRYTEPTQVSNYYQREFEHKEQYNYNKQSTSNVTKKGCLVFQTSWYDAKQLQCIDAAYKSNYKSAPRFLFGDNDQDKERSSYQKRQMFGGQAAVVGKYDRTIGYGIVTTFFSGRTPSINEYKRKMDEAFKPLCDHLRNGYDVIVPYPTSKDINSNRYRYYDRNKQVIFHNLGTGIASLSSQHIQYIQQKINELKKIARKVDYAMHYNYDPKIDRLLTHKPSQYHNAPKESSSSHGHSQSGPQANEWQQKASDSKPKPAPQYAPPSDFVNPEWTCNICSVICQSYHTKCNKCNAPKGAKKEVAPVQSPAVQKYQPHFSPNTNEVQKLRNQIAELQNANMSLNQKVNDHMSDLQTANVQLQQMETLKKDTDKETNASDAEIMNLKHHVMELETQLNAKGNESVDCSKLKQERDDALKQLKQKQSQLAQYIQDVDELKQQNKDLLTSQKRIKIELKSKEAQLNDAQETQLNAKENESVDCSKLKQERDDALNQLKQYMQDNNELKQQNQNLLNKVQLKSKEDEQQSKESMKMDKLQTERDDAVKKETESRKEIEKLNREIGSRTYQIECLQKKVEEKDKRIQELMNKSTMQTMKSGNDTNKGLENKKPDIRDHEDMNMDVDDDEKTHNSKENANAPDTDDHLKNGSIGHTIGNPNDENEDDDLL